MTENALLERVLAEADPARTPRDASPDAAALVMRDRIVRSGAPTRRPRRTAVRWASGLVAAAAATAVAFAVAVPAGQAVAGTPRPLDFDGETTVAQIVADAQAELAAAGGPVEPERFVRSASWSFSVDVSAGDTTVVPQLSELSWQPDLSGHVLIVDGVAYDPADAAANTSAEVTSSGRVVADRAMAPGEFATPVAEVPGAERGDVLALLQAFGMPEEPTASDIVTAMTSVLGQWTLTDAQQAEMLGLLAETDGAEALGGSVDRLGRDVTGLRVQSADGAVSDVVLISSDTGRIVGVERTNLRDDGVMPAGAIVAYQMWDVEERMIG